LAHVGRRLCEPLVQQPAVSALIGERDAIPEREFAVGPPDCHARKVAHVAWTTVDHDSSPGIGKLPNGFEGVW
jgi:hypothetical protein